MSENTNLPVLLKNLPPEKITRQTVVAIFNTEKVRLNYNKMLQGLEGLEISPSTLKSEYPEFKEADKFIKTITEWRKDITRSFSDIPALFLSVANEILQPISDALESKKAQVKAANEINAAEIAKAKKEQERIDNITLQMGVFLNKITADITLVTTDDQIVSIQKRIGAEKSRTGFYSEFIDDFRSKCDNLHVVINDQKDKIRKLAAFNKQFDLALSKNDEHAAAAIKEKIEETTESLTENSIRLQEQAFSQALNIPQVQVGQPEVNTVKPKTHRWLWKIEDIQLLRKKQPELTKIVPDEEAIEYLLKEKREAGDFKDQLEVRVNGILFFKQKYL